MDELLGQTELGARRFSPIRLAHAFAFELVGIDKVANAAAETAQEQAGRRSPMPGEKGRLIDHAKADLARGQDGARPLAASAGIEIVTMEIEQHDTRPLDPFEQRVEPRRIQAPRLIELVEAAKSCRRGR